jgi:hypothetical protein
MPLLDHFRPPLAGPRHWESFHAAWASEVMAILNRRVLPPGYFAETQVHVGSRVEADVPTFEGRTPAAGNGHTGGVAVETWAPPATSLVLPLVFPDEIEIQVFRSSGGATLVAAVELVSPSNKDRPETRRLFAAKCASYLASGVGLVVVDVVTERTANLHDELVGLLGGPEATRFPGAELYAVSYRPARSDSGEEQATVWPFPLAVGQALPVVPLALRGGPTLPLDLEETYTETRARSRL